MPSYDLPISTGEFLINSSATAQPEGWSPVGTVDLRLQSRKSIATDICKGSGYCASDPITLDCSLACTAIGWPMQGGWLMIELLQQPSSCATAGEIPSVYGPQVYVSFGCQPNDPVVDGVWQGESYTDMVAITSGGISYGLTLKVCARMVVNPSGTLSVTAEINRVAPVDDINPPPPSGQNQVIPCGTISATLGWFYPSPSINTTRIYTYPGGTSPNQLIDFNVTNPDNCPLDVKSVRLTLVMNPFKVGCNGTAEGYLETDCSLDTGFRTYSCFSVLIKPKVEGSFVPSWIQLGVNDRPTSSNHGCYQGSNSGTGLSPPVVAYMNPERYGGGPPYANDLMNCGCTGEDPVNRDFQQIQYGSTQGTFGANSGDPVYEIVIKSVNKGSPCVAMRLYGTGNPWYVGSLTLNNAIFAETGHWVVTATFYGLFGDPVAIIYGLQFPNGIIASCVPEPSMMPAMMSQQDNSINNQEIIKEQIVSTSISNEIIQKVQETKKRMALVKNNPCAHLGKQLEDVPSCGCAGGNLHECAKYGTCRITGNTKEMNCWRCPDYIDQASNNDKI